MYNAVQNNVVAVHKSTHTRTYFNKHSTLLVVKFTDPVKGRRSPSTNSVVTKTLSYHNESVLTWCYISIAIIRAGSM
jgi:hypothetical protein